MRLASGVLRRTATPLFCCDTRVNTRDRMGAISEPTPLMKQYGELKAEAGDALLLFRMGDFYELFGQDAVDAARILDITLTSRDKGKENPLPMAGVPHHSAQGYIQKLLDSGHKVAIGEQVESSEVIAAKGQKAIVKREIVRVFSPGIQFDREGSERRLVACATADENRSSWFLACLDVSTGETWISEGLSEAALAQELAAQPIHHLIKRGGQLPDAARAAYPPDRFAEDIPSNTLALTQAKQLLCELWGVTDLRALIASDAAILALGVVLHTVFRSQKVDRLDHIRRPAPLRQSTSLVFGPETPAHLDLEDLYRWLNRTRSAVGARTLRQWLWAPLTAPEAIERRQMAVRCLRPRREKLQKALSEIYDIERIVGRLQAGLASPKDTLALGQTLSAVQVLISQLGTHLDPLPALTPWLRDQLERARISLKAVSGVGAEILLTQREEAPLTTREGGIFKAGTTPELDRLLDLAENGSRWLVELETRERQVTGIGSLKVRYNRVFGYYIEITTAHLKNVPAHYMRKQTMVGAERFFTEELKKFEEEILSSNSRQKNLEQQLFENLCERLRRLHAPLADLASWIGCLDALCCLAGLSDEAGFCWPKISNGLDLMIEAGRHPLVDAANPGRFVPNTVSLQESGARCLLITGPNMGGKSTVMRQTALVVILGQMGAPVPAKHASWGAVSKLYTRIGAHDAIAKGQSTFMVEMTELAHLLQNADERSLVVLDEIGRGTSTYDGISVAWSTLEHLSALTRCRTLFATHYHELTGLEAELPGLANAHMAVAQDKGLRFLYELRSGPAADSFGIQVAQMAGIPKSVINRAWQILKVLESKSAPQGSGIDLNQLNLFSAPAPLPVPMPDPRAAEIQAEIERADVNSMTPLQALNFVSRLRDLAANQ